jgi:hypothetical protein
MVHANIMLQLPQAVLPLRCDGSVGQGDPQLAVVALLLDLVRDAHPCLFFFKQEGEAWVVLVRVGVGAVVAW